MLYTNELAVSLLADLQCRPPVSVFTSHTCTTSPFCTVKLNNNLCSITSLYSLIHVVAGPSHVHHDGSTSTIDLVIVPDPSLVNSCNHHHYLLLKHISCQSR